MVVIFPLSSSKNPHDKNPKDWTPSQLAQALEAMSHLRSLGCKKTPMERHELMGDTL
jgi:hypothetical protein